MSEWTDVAAEGDIRPGRCKIVDVDDAIIAVYNLDGEYHAIEDVCTHDGGELASGDVEDDVVICPRHGARFCIRNGRALTAPAYEDVPTFPVRVENGKIQVRDDRWD
ncbi:MAG: non-heme iron oxygenase ferredoxin subunit [Salinisphaeraceae bacterium]|nr:non-heme iron oxygenase ferredoxin subunit [Salinisphaeraceae bacterium]